MRCSLTRRSRVSSNGAYYPGTARSAQGRLGSSPRGGRRMPKPYEALLELARDIILFIATDGRIIDANAAALEAYGYTREELCERTITDLRSPVSAGSPVGGPETAPEIGAQ